MTKRGMALGAALLMCTISTAWGGDKAFMGDPAHSGYCNPHDKVYEADNSDSSYNDLVFRCGGVKHLYKRWVCRSNPAIRGDDGYDVAVPCPGEKSEYQRLIEQGSGSRSL